MAFRVIDYSDIYYGTITKEPKPHRRAGKFIQLLHEDTEYIVLSPSRLSPFHANILERFCRTKGISGRYRTRKMDNFEVTDPDLEVAGGGLWEMDDEEKTLTLSGSSAVYGTFDRNGLKERLKSTGSLRNYRILIR